MSTLQQTLYNVHRKFAKRVLALFVRINDKSFTFGLLGYRSERFEKIIGANRIRVTVIMRLSCERLSQSQFEFALLAGFSASPRHFFSPFLSLLVSEVTKQIVCR